MAFNPFEAFRKNSKPLMAALTIFVMIVFVLSTGGGGSDFFDWLARALGGRDARGQMMGTIEGDEYYDTTLQEVRLRRAAANAFMMTAAGMCDQKLLTLVDADLKNNVVKDPIRQQQLTQALTSRNQFLMFAERAPARERAQFAEFFYRQYVDMQNEAARIGDKDNPTEARLYRYLSKVYYHDSIRVRFAGNMYFGQIPNQNQQEALQFAMFLRLADKMAVKYSHDDVQRLIRSETEIELTPDEASKIDNAVRQNRFRNVTATQMLDAIADEFRVLTALKVMRGGDYSGRSSIPAGMTPYELYEFYKDRCGEVTFDVIDVPVEPFIDKVTETPPEKDLQNLFDKYKAQEPDPTRATPGFKEPRRVKLEYVEVDATKPVYKKVLPLLEAAGAFGGGSSASFSGGAVTAIVEAAGPMLVEAELVSQAERAAREVARFEDLFHMVRFHGLGPKPALAQFLGQAAQNAPDLPLFARLAVTGLSQVAADRLPARAPFDVRLKDTSVQNAVPLASLGAYLATPMANGFVAPYLGAVGLTDWAELIETRDRVKTGVQMTLAPMSPLAQVYPVAEIASLLRSLPPDPLPMLTADRNAARHARRPEVIARKDLESLEKALQDTRKSFTPEDTAKDDPLKKKAPTKNDAQKVAKANADARKIVQDWIAGHPGFKTGQSAKLTDRYRIAEDPALKGSVDEMRMIGIGGVDNRVADLFFNPEELSDVEAAKFRPQVVSDLLGGKDARDFGRPVFMAWKIDDREPKNYDVWRNAPQDVRDQVLKAWKTEKARALAKQAADDIAAKVRDLAGKELRGAANNMPAFRNGVRELATAEKFKLYDDAITVAKLRREIPREAGPPRYVGPRINNKQIEFPLTSQNPFAPAPDGDQMADQLLELRSQPLGETLVQPNRPQSHYYVSALVKKETLTVQDFYNNVFTLMNVPRGHERDRDTLYLVAVETEAFPAFEKDLIERIKAEMKYTETDALKEQKDKGNDPFE